MTLKELVRPNIWNLKPYSCARNEFKGEAHVWLDANENPLNNPYNRYPDPLQLKLKEKIAQLRGVKVENIFLGVGSDECIDIIYRVFCEPAKDNVVAITPTYGMYEVCADINNVEYKSVELTEDFGLNIDALLSATDDNTKVMWICSPNNPTGNAFQRAELKELCQRFAGILVIDEAYIDFSEHGSMLEFIRDFPRLIVMQTFSKAWGSAGVRLGLAFANHEIIDIFNKVKYPYNINLLTQNYAIELLSKQSEVEEWVKMLLSERAKMQEELKSIDFIEKIYPSDANFLLIKVADADSLYHYLCDEGIIIRNRNKVTKCGGCVRITIGTAPENEELLKSIKNYGK